MASPAPDAGGESWRNDGLDSALELQLASEADYRGDASVDDAPSEPIVVLGTRLDRRETARSAGALSLVEAAGIENARICELCAPCPLSMPCVDPVAPVAGTALHCSEASDAKGDAK